MSIEYNKALVRRYVEEIVNKGNLDLIEEIFVAGYADTPLWPKAAYDGDAVGIARLKDGLIMLHKAFPDFNYTIEAMCAEGDTVMVYGTVRGTHTGGWFFDVAPTGKQVWWTDFHVHRVAHGKIVEDRWLWDRLGAWQQLGLVPETHVLFANASRQQSAISRQC